MLVAVELAVQLLGVQRSGDRPDGLVGFLRVLRLGAVVARLFRQRVGAEAAANDRAHLLHGLRGQRHRVGAHVGDQARGAFAEIHALVQPLRGPHGFLRGEAELARGFLLQGRGGEGRRRVLAPLAPLDARDLELAGGGLAQGALRFVRGAGVADEELLELVVEPLAGVLGEPCRKGLAVLFQFRFQCPVLDRLEGLDLPLALDDQPERGGLHAPGREPGADLLPQQGREVEAHQVIQRSPRLLRVHQVAGDLARVFQRFLHGAAGDLVEHDAVHGAVVEQAALAQRLAHVPADGFALTVGVGGEVEGIGALHRLGDGIEMPAIALDLLVSHGEAGGRVDRALFRYQVADMTVGSEHLEVAAEVLLDGPGLGRRFNDDEILAHFNSLVRWSKKRAVARATTPVLRCAGRVG